MFLCLSLSSKAVLVFLAGAGVGVLAGHYLKLWPSNNSGSWDDDDGAISTPVKVWPYGDWNEDGLLDSLHGTLFLLHAPTYR